MSQEKAKKILETIKTLQGVIGIEQRNGRIVVYVDNTTTYNIINEPLKQLLRVDVFCVRPRKDFVKKTWTDV